MNYLFPGLVSGDEIEQIKEELDEHLEVLNQNTAEVLSLMEYLGEIEQKLDKLTERVDLVQSSLDFEVKTKEIRLSAKESGVLKVLFSASEPVTSMEIGRHAGLTSDIVAQTLYCLREKGVPVLAHDLDERTFYVLDNEFRKKNNQKHLIDA